MRYRQGRKGSLCLRLGGEGTVTGSEKSSVEEMQSPIRLNTTNGEVVSSKQLQAPVRSSTLADAPAMKGCPNSLSLRRMCLGKEFSC